MLFFHPLLHSMLRYSVVQYNTVYYTISEQWKMSSVSKFYVDIIQILHILCIVLGLFLSTCFYNNTCIQENHMNCSHIFMYQIF